MGLFFPSDPIVHGQRAKGLPRYQELLERDWKSFLFADFVTLGLCIPLWFWAWLRAAFFQPTGAAPGLHSGRASGRPGDLRHDGCVVPQLPGCAPRLVGELLQGHETELEILPPARHRILPCAGHRAVLRHGAVLCGTAARHRHGDPATGLVASVRVVFAVDGLSGAVLFVCFCFFLLMHGHFNDWRSFDRPDPDRQG